MQIRGHDDHHRAGAADRHAAFRRLAAGHRAFPESNHSAPRHAGRIRKFHLYFGQFQQEHSMRWRLLITISLLCLVLNSCKRDSSSSNASEIVLGEYASMTGTTASFGLSSHEGGLLAIDEINSAGGVLGKKIKMISEDDRSDANEAVTAVQKLISRDKVVAILGEVASKRSLAGANVCQK